MSRSLPLLTLCLLLLPDLHSWSWADGARTTTCALRTTYQAGWLTLHSRTCASVTLALFLHTADNLNHELYSNPSIAKKKKVCLKYSIHLTWTPKNKQKNSTLGFKVREKFSPAGTGLAHQSSSCTHKRKEVRNPWEAQGLRDTILHMVNFKITTAKAGVSHILWLSNQDQEAILDMSQPPLGQDPWRAKSA